MPIISHRSEASILQTHKFTRQLQHQLLAFVCTICECKQDRQQRVVSSPVLGKHKALSRATRVVLFVVYFRFTETTPTNTWLKLILFCYIEHRKAPLRSKPLDSKPYQLTSQYLDKRCANITTVNISRKDTLATQRASPLRKRLQVAPPSYYYCLSRRLQASFATTRVSTPRSRNNGRPGPREEEVENGGDEGTNAGHADGD